VSSDRDAIHSLLIVPTGAVNPKMGGGQRTALLFGALKELGPVSVVMLNPDGNSGASEFFPGAARFEAVVSKQVANPPRRNKLALWRRRLSNFLFVKSFFGVERDTSDSVNSIVESIRPDVVVARYFRSASIAGVRSSSERPVVIDIDDRDDQKFEALGRRLFGPGLFFSLYERIFVRKVRDIVLRGLKLCDHAWLAAAGDNDVLKGVVSHSLLPNVPYVHRPLGYQRCDNGKTVLFVGSEGHVPNRVGVFKFLDEVWPLVVQRNREARVRVVGMGDWPGTLTDYDGRQNVDVVGFVDDLAAEYASASVAVSPIYEGGGTKIKVLEAMAFQVPVVATPHSCRGFVEPVVDVASVAEAPEDFAAAILELLEDDGRRAETGVASEQVVEQNYSSDAFRRAVGTAIRGVVAG